MGRAAPQPSDLELQILSVLWDRGPCTARDVLEAMPDGKERAYTSILSVMQVMQKKGLVGTAGRRRGLAHVYRAKVDRKQVLGPLLRGLVTKVFAGSPVAVVQQLLAETDVSDDDRREIRRLLAKTKDDKR